jgi:hypothetical protein
MEHWTEAQEPSANPGIKAAETFAEHFVVEDAEGSILRDELYMAYVRWTADRGHDPVSQRKFFEAVTGKVSYDVTAITQNLEWVQRLDGLGLSFVNAF